MIRVPGVRDWLKKTDWPEANDAAFAAVNDIRVYFAIK